MPLQNWLPLWLLSIGLAVAAVFAYEMFWRGRHHTPSVVDTTALWAQHRQMLTAADTPVVALVGTSRMQLGFDTDVVRTEYPRYRVADLAVQGLHPVATLIDLAEDERFHGIVICDITPFGLTKYSWNDQQEYVSYFHHSYTYTRAIDVYLSSRLQNRFVIFHPRTRFDALLRRAFDGAGPLEPSYIATRLDRSRQADFSIAQVDAIRQQTIERRKISESERPAPPPDEWIEQVRQLAPAVSRIQQRGGEVVFVHFPVDGETWEIDQATYPRAKYWDRLGPLSRAKVLHFEDVPALRAYKLPDTSHLDYRDAKPFTSALLKELARTGVLAN